MFELENNWQKEWKDMPEFVQKDLEAYKTIMVNFETKEDMVAFSKLINQVIGKGTKSIWFPKVEYEKIINKRYVDAP